MSYFCRDCNNNTRFTEEQTGTCVYWKKVLIDEDDEIIETLDGPDHSDYECDDGEYLTCNECGSRNIGNDEDEDPEIARAESREANNRNEDGTPNWRSRFQR